LARAVLGIDAAWTAGEPSGVALITDGGTGWRLLEVAASYEQFPQGDAAGARISRPRGSIPDEVATVRRQKLFKGVTSSSCWTRRFSAWQPLFDFRRPKGEGMS